MENLLESTIIDENGNVINYFKQNAEIKDLENIIKDSGGMVQYNFIYMHENFITKKAEMAINELILKHDYHIFII